MCIVVLSTEEAQQMDILLLVVTMVVCGLIIYLVLKGTDFDNE